MMMSIVPHDVHKSNAWTFIGRALRLRCPECGVSRIFKPWRQTRSLSDWFSTLHGCPRCGYAYEREQGYFLLAIWGLNYGLIAGLAVIITYTLDELYSPPLWKQILFVVAPMPIFSVLFARHSKALYLALDHFCDPQAHEDQDDEVNLSD
jgi:uncharacterized protein (DUF983 family)